MEIRCDRLRQLEIPLDKGPQIESWDASSGVIANDELRRGNERSSIHERLRVRKGPR
jgi:hypothetical protein